jgi:hypothetical protein
MYVAVGVQAGSVSCLRPALNTRPVITIRAPTANRPIISREDQAGRPSNHL